MSPELTDLHARVEEVLIGIAPRGDPLCKYCLLRELLAEAKALREQNRWIPVSEAPRTGEHILAAIFDGGIGLGTCGGKEQPWQGVIHWWAGDPDMNCEDEGWYMSTANGDIEIKPTHWRPLPSPPENA